MALNISISGKDFSVYLVNDKVIKRLKSLDGLIIDPNDRILIDLDLQEVYVDFDKFSVSLYGLWDSTLLSHNSTPSGVIETEIRIYAHNLIRSKSLNEILN